MEFYPYVCKVFHVYPIFVLQYCIGMTFNMIFDHHIITVYLFLNKNASNRLKSKLFLDNIKKIHKHINFLSLFSKVLLSDRFNIYIYMKNVDMREELKPKQLHCVFF